MIPPNLPFGIWMVANGIWCFIPESADHADIGMARRMLHRIELDRLQDGARYDRLIEALKGLGADNGGT